MSVGEMGGWGSVILAGFGILALFGFVFILWLAVRWEEKRAKGDCKDPL